MSERETWVRFAQRQHRFQQAFDLQPDWRWMQRGHCSRNDEKQHIQPVALLLVGRIQKNLFVVEYVFLSLAPTSLAAKARTKSGACMYTTPRRFRSVGAGGAGGALSTTKYTSMGKKAIQQVAARDPHDILHEELKVWHQPARACCPLALTDVCFRRKRWRALQHWRPRLC